MASRDCKKFVTLTGPSGEHRVTVDTHKTGRVHGKGTELQRCREARDQEKV